MSVIRYRPEIDGLRSVAVIPVILFHLGFGWIPGGFAGVDVFFVISGFLITSIILKEFDGANFTFAGFWMRRVRRILPALFTVVFAVLLFTAVFGYRVDNPAIGFQGLAAMLSVANIFMWRSTGDYWGNTAENSPFLHCWSLSVEEQFYLFYPLFLFLLLKQARRLVIPVVGAAMLGSFVLFVVGSFKFPVATFYLLPTRGWELAAGCLIAILNRDFLVRVPQIGRELFQNFGVFLILLSFFILPAGRPSPLLVLPVLGTAAFILFGSGGSGAARILSWSPIVYIGKISYSLYIWHWPVIVLTRQAAPSFGETGEGTALMALLTIALSVFSYHFIELPLRSRHASLVPIGVGFAASLGLVAVVINQLDLTPYDTSPYERVVNNSLHYDVVPSPPPKSEILRKKMAGVSTRERDPGSEQAYRKTGIVKVYGGERPDIVVFGDSHAAMWSSLIDQISAELGLTTAFFGAIGSTPYFDDGSQKRSRLRDGFTAQQSHEFDAARKRVMDRARPLVVISARWSNRNDPAGLEELVEYAGSTACHVLLIEQPPEILIGDRNSAQFIAYLGLKPVPGDRVALQEANSTRVKAANRDIRKLAEKYPFCEVVSTYDLLSRGQGKVDVLAGRDILYYDDDHVSEAGARMVKERLKEIIGDRFTEIRGSETVQVPKASDISSPPVTR